MRREELTARLSDFEAKSDVAEWRWDGFRAWPVVRTQLALALHHAGEKGAREQRATLGARVMGKWNTLRRRVLAIGSTSLPSERADVIFVTHFDRCQHVAGRPIHTLVDPWLDALQTAGLKARAWCLGDPYTAPAQRFTPIQYAIDQDVREAVRSSASAPDWFAALAKFVETDLEVRFDPLRIRFELEAVARCGARFEAWLRGAAPQSVVVDGWYLRERMAVILAARRLGIPSFDLQHGIQGAEHPAYGGWSARPPGGFEVLPDHFCVWGERDAQALVRNNPGVVREERVHVTGHPWLTRWTRGTDPSLESEIESLHGRLAGRKSILVTLQKGVPFEHELLPIIAMSPPDWHWAVRLHRSSHDSAADLERSLRSKLQRDIDVVEATARPLYAWLSVCEAHLTAFSTVALEALAFGVASVVTHESGARAFGEFIEAGVMAHAASPASALASLQQTRSQRACVAAAEPVFARNVSVPPFLSPESRVR